MPIKIPEGLPATEILTKENIFIMTEARAVHQDIRPLRIVILNLMPLKIVTETQLLRVLGNTPLQLDITLLHPGSYQSKNTPEEHLSNFYHTFAEIRDQKFDGLIITGAPVEQMEFEEVAYWPELQEIMKWSLKNVYSNFYICWGAQAALYYHFGVRKYQLPQKKFGVFSHRINERYVKLLRGFDDQFEMPHSRHTQTRREELEKISQLEILAESEEAGVALVASKCGKHIFAMGHSEYEPLTLKLEYERDVARGLAVDLPQNYFPGNDLTKEPLVKWRGHAHLLFANWLNYYVYQETPYNLEELKERSDK